MALLQNCKGVECLHHSPFTYSPSFVRPKQWRSANVVTLFEASAAAVGAYGIVSLLALPRNARRRSRKYTCTTYNSVSKGRKKGIFVYSCTFIQRKEMMRIVGRTAARRQQLFTQRPSRSVAFIVQTSLSRRSRSRVIIWSSFTGGGTSAVRRYRRIKILTIIWYLR